jgi:hypothetical protein
MINTLIEDNPQTMESLVGGWRSCGRERIKTFENGSQSFISDLLPELAIKFPIFQTLDILRNRLGNETLYKALDPTQTIVSPVYRENNGEWLKKSNMVGVNVRTIGSFWNVINYAFTLPQSHDSIHLLPIWEPGVVGSLYGKVSWNINNEFFNYELFRILPALDTVEKQLKVMVNLLHALGKTVGLDIIPHNDRFSEIVLTHPRLFEWVRREGTRIADHSESVYQSVEKLIWNYLGLHGTATQCPLPPHADLLFDADETTISDSHRQEIIFGLATDREGRLSRRIALIDLMVTHGFETLPMTMAPPYRGLHINPEVFVTDERGTKWYQYDFDQPQAMSRVFGPLTRYKFFHSKDDNQQWELDFENPQGATWRYFCRKYAECQAQFGFDFMRGDMAHVQMQPNGVPTQINATYDPLRAAKRHIHRIGARHFAFYAETFLTPPGHMGYGDELDHLEAIEADATLGDLQSTVVGSNEFMCRFAHYDQWLRSRRFAPSFTVMTADKDDPRFDEFYRTGNLLRYFTSLFLTDMPSYVALGFEARNLHQSRGQNEEYSKLYVFQIRDETETDKVTHGPYIWGKNASQFKVINRLRIFAENIWKKIENQPITWILNPDPTGNQKLMAWTLSNDSSYVFVVNWDTHNSTPIPQALNEAIASKFIRFDTLADTESLPPYTHLRAGQAVVFG